VEVRVLSSAPSNFGSLRYTTRLFVGSPYRLVSQSGSHNGVLLSSRVVDQVAAFLKRREFLRETC